MFKVKFSIGYKLPDEVDSVYSICADFKESVSNVYFSFGNNPSGRSPLSHTEDEAYVKDLQTEELRAIKDMGISLTLLYNANCYGENALSKSLVDGVLKEVYDLKHKLSIDRITTTSPLLAQWIKKEFQKDIQVFASVNMRIGTVAAMEQLSEDFDGFYVQKEVNRNLKEIERLKSYTDSVGKKLCILANSGCLAHCAFQTFHDNLVAHEAGIIHRDNVPSDYAAPCWRFLDGLEERKALTKILGSNWIRPEEVHLYEPYFDEMKLATRLHQRMRMVVSAYVHGKYYGNLMDLTEPAYSALFRGTVLDNTKIPDDYAAHMTRCDHNCAKCGYCERILDDIITEF
ncbi:MAG: hypothetical protein IJD83_10065 [Clostridia bacterium]|nr:hypothetical protein [Clostridia bacterium]